MATTPNPSPDIRDYLQSQQVDFETLPHAHALTARDTAESAHVDRHEMAKTVMVKLDGNLAMAVLPADEWLELDALCAATGAGQATLATEDEFRDRFPECEVGAMPPFGNLYGLDVIVADSLAADERIAFNAGNHQELLRMRWDDFARLVQPRIEHMTRH